MCSIDSQYGFQFEPYQRKFKQPLRTSHGIWQIREGIIISLCNSEGKIAKGEIAPIPWFGSETIAEAFSFCQQQGSIITPETIYHISDRLPACQFAFESALQNIRGKLEEATEDLFDCCYLLPTGKEAIALNYEKIADSSTFKWKIALEEADREIARAKQLLTKLPARSKLRLDANGGLTIEEAKKWLTFAEQQSQIEYIEQPLPPEQFQTMIEFKENYDVTLALDESVTNIRQLIDCYEKGWRDVFVVKSAIAGFPSLLREFSRRRDLDLVFSSVFETAIGRQAALRLAVELSNRSRALGFGVERWF